MIFLNGLKVEVSPNGNKDINFKYYNKPNTEVKEPLDLSLTGADLLYLHEDGSDLMGLLLLAQKYTITDGTKLNLHIPYLPDGTEDSNSVSPASTFVAALGNFNGATVQGLLWHSSAENIVNIKDSVNVEYTSMDSYWGDKIENMILKDIEDNDLYRSETNIVTIGETGEVRHKSVKNKFIYELPKTSSDQCGFLVLNKEKYETRKGTSIKVPRHLEKDIADEGVKRYYILEDILQSGDTVVQAIKVLKDKSPNAEFIIFCPHIKKEFLKSELLKDPKVLGVYTTNSIIREEHEKIHLLFNFFPIGFNKEAMERLQNIK